MFFSWRRQLCSLVDKGLTHVDKVGQYPRMVDVSLKSDTLRVAVAIAEVFIPSDVMALSKRFDTNIEFQSPKGPVLSTAIVAGVMGAKKTSDIIPFCHPIPISGCDIVFNLIEDFPNKSDRFGGKLEVRSTVRTIGKTGVEMEALVSASTAALCIYDMLKSISHDIVISNVRLLSKSGGKSDIESIKLSND